MKKEINLGILTVPLIKSGIPHLENLINVTNSCFKSIILITGNEGYEFFRNDPRVVCYGVTIKYNPKLLIKILNFLYIQILESFLVAKASKNVDVWIFFLGEERQVLPIIVAKLFNKRVIISSSGSSRQCAQFANDPYLHYVVFLSKITYYFSDCLILYSTRFIDDLNLQKLKRKIFISHSSYIDINKFYLKTPLNKRHKIVGYLGRLSPEKGILNFINSVPEILNNIPDLRVFIVGIGDLQNQLMRYIKELNLSDRVYFFGWINDENLPSILNEMQLLIIPSYTEGLPSVLLQSMACGTPVITSPVGAIPEIIINEKNGFLLKNNSPDEISKEIIEIFQNFNLSEISDNARDTVLQKFSFKPIAEEYCKIIKSQLL